MFGSAEDLSCEDLSCLYSNTFFNGFARFRANSVSPQLRFAPMRCFPSYFVLTSLRFTLSLAVLLNMIPGTTSCPWTKRIVVLSQQTQIAVRPRILALPLQLSTQTLVEPPTLVPICPLNHAISIANGKPCGTVEYPRQCLRFLSASTLTFAFANATAVPVVSDETCLRATPSQSQIGIVVFNGTCSRLGCVSGNDEDRHRQGKSWRALPGVQYG